MSTEKGELIGITEKELFKLGASLPYNDGIRCIALAAQRALAAWLLAGRGEWHDIPEAGGRCFCVYKPDMDEVCAKLGVK